MNFNQSNKNNPDMEEMQNSIGHFQSEFPTIVELVEHLESLDFTCTIYGDRVLVSYGNDQDANIWLDFKFMVQYKWFRGILLRRKYGMGGSCDWTVESYALPKFQEYHPPHVENMMENLLPPGAKTVKVIESSKIDGTCLFAWTSPNDGGLHLRSQRSMNPEEQRMFKSLEEAWNYLEANPEIQEKLTKLCENPDVNTVGLEFVGSPCTRNLVVHYEKPALYIHSIIGNDGRQITGSELIVCCELYGLEVLIPPLASVEEIPVERLQEHIRQRSEDIEEISDPNVEGYVLTIEYDGAIVWSFKLKTNLFVVLQCDQITELHLLFFPKYRNWNVLQPKKTELKKAFIKFLIDQDGNQNIFRSWSRGANVFNKTNKPLWRKFIASFESSDYDRCFEIYCDCVPNCLDDYKTRKAFIKNLRAFLSSIDFTCPSKRSLLIR